MALAKRSRTVAFMQEPSVESLDAQIRDACSKARFGHEQLTRGHRVAALDELDRLCHYHPDGTVTAAATGIEQG